MNSIFPAPATGPLPQLALHEFTPVFAGPALFPVPALAGLSAVRRLPGRPAGPSGGPGPSRPAG